MEITDGNYRWKLPMGRGHVSCDVTLPHDGLFTESKHIFSDPIMDPILLEKQNKKFFHQLLFFMLPDTLPQLGKPLGPCHMTVWSRNRSIFFLTTLWIPFYSKNKTKIFFINFYFSCYRTH